MELEYEIISKCDNIKIDIKKAISILNKYNTNTGFVDSVIKELEIPLDGSYYELLEDYDFKFFINLPRTVKYSKSFIIFHYNDYDNFGGGLAITINQKEFYSFNDVITYLKENNDV